MHLPPQNDKQQDYFTMNKSEKTTFGQHLERGLTRLGEGIRESVKANQDGELMDIKLGLMTDAEKLRFLKQDLYQAARGRGSSEHINNLKCAIATIEKSIEQEFHRHNTLEAVVSRYITTAFLLGVTAVLASFAISWGCGDSKSQFCSNFKAISNTVLNQFKEPEFNHY